MRYSEEFKKSAVEKYLTRGSRTVKETTNALGVSLPTVFRWRDEFANVGGMKKSSQPNNRPGNEKLKLLIEFDFLPIEKRGEFLRSKGLFEENLNSWRKEIEEILSPTKKISEDKIELHAVKQKVHKLEKELRRKDAALAEASALLILKKKAALIWGTGEDE